MLVAVHLLAVDRDDPLAHLEVALLAHAAMREAEDRGRTHRAAKADAGALTRVLLE